jgi:hypothetical protein
MGQGDFLGGRSGFVPEKAEASRLPLDVEAIIPVKTIPRGKRSMLPGNFGTEEE